MKLYSNSFAMLLSVVTTTASLLMLCPAAAHAQGGLPLWTNRYGGPANYADGATAIALDGNGNVFVTGISRGGAYDDSADYVTIKYSSAGVPLWTNRYDGPGNGMDFAAAITMDSSGNVFVTGQSRGSENTDYATIAYSNSGVPLWTNRYNGPGNNSDVATAIVLDSSGNIIVTGYSANNPSAPYDRDYATIAYSNSGIPLWTNRYDGSAGNDHAYAVAVDSSGNVFVTGESRSGGELTGDYATVAYSSAGDLLWINHYNGPTNGWDYARAIAVDHSGNAIVAGYSANDYVTIAYSNAGMPLWTNRYNGPGNGGDEALAIVADKSGNAFVTGYSGIAGSEDYATIKYSNAGVPIWTRRYNGPGNGFDIARGIALDSSGNVFVTGASTGISFSSDYATIAYSSTGAQLWTSRFGSGESGAIAVDHHGNVFVTGSSWNGTNYSDYVTIKYSSSVPPPRLDLQRLNNQLVLSWTNASFNLQSAPFVTGPFTNLPAATSPYTNPFTAPQQFFRLNSN